MILPGIHDSLLKPVILSGIHSALLRQMILSGILDSVFRRVILSGILDSLPVAEQVQVQTKHSSRYGKHSHISLSSSRGFPHPLHLEYIELPPFHSFREPIVNIKSFIISSIYLIGLK